jgi:hypothetical protein
MFACYSSITYLNIYAFRDMCLYTYARAGIFVFFSMAFQTIIQSKTKTKSRNIYYVHGEFRRRFHEILRNF